MLDMNELRLMYLGQIRGDNHRLMILDQNGKEQSGEVKAAWIDLKPIPLDHEEYRTIRAHLFSVLAPIRFSIHLYAPEWLDLVGSDARDDEVTIEDVYRALAPRVVGWSYSLEVSTLGGAVDPPGVSRNPMASMALLDTGSLFGIVLYLLRNSELLEPLWSSFNRFYPPIEL